MVKLNVYSKDQVDTIIGAIPTGPSFNTAMITVPAQGGTVTCTGMTSTQLVWVSPTQTYFNVYADQGCRCTAQATNQLTFAVNTTQTSSMNVNVVWTEA